MGSLLLDALSKRYGASMAVERVDLDVRQGEMVALLGPSGCGKTTTLRMVAGFVPPSGGRVVIGGKDVTRAPPHARDTGMVFQSYALFPHMTVGQNVAFGLEMRRVNRADREARAREALRMVRLEGLEDRLPRQLSGGQQQRVALARALVVKPAVFLLDEPLSNLDAKLRGEVRMEIRALQQRLGLTTLIVTHDQEEALTMADRLVVMERGRVRQVGTAEELYEQPADPFVAGFVGRCNLVEGRVEGPGRFRARSGALLPCAAAATPTGDAILALRPEHVAIAPEGPARLHAVTYLGPQTEYHAELEGTPLVAIRPTPGPADPLRRLSPGDAVSLTWDIATARLLPATPNDKGA
ncbi:ABC transporter ATP-binding protein [Pseudoroseomonas ludipueritiae]|uniref:ABC transporter ATP-binding protein n=1 Tax=Pseudoroseomonas ludipueritiae TaxID=198093 RepID=A0ABR7R5I3_9PROT|nr:ABC transporter ATP-binding protein [Pseudoroseomonas ludipueritiae]MBC9176922.1 ABC transporter ATP-binding protein [Pseudoroseomonas ludipueritiae]MCG7361524.1 ABC transporter ATP-binding protein [Roseomonas sp. ACRSG]